MITKLCDLFHRTKLNLIFFMFFYMWNLVKILSLTVFWGVKVNKNLHPNRYIWVYEVFFYGFCWLNFKFPLVCLHVKMLAICWKIEKIKTLSSVWAFVTKLLQNKIIEDGRKTVVKIKGHVEYIYAHRVGLACEYVKYFVILFWSSRFILWLLFGLFGIQLENHKMIFTFF